MYINRPLFDSLSSFERLIHEYNPNASLKKAKTPIFCHTLFFIPGGSFSVQVAWSGIEYIQERGMGFGFASVVGAMWILYRHPVKSNEEIRNA
jgi:hypothetical protein